MKKILLLTVFACMALLVACSGGANETPITPGVWETDELFVNESIGLQFQVPRGWEGGMDAEEVLASAGDGLQFLQDYSDLPIEEMQELLEDVQLIDMIVLHPMTGSTVQIELQRLPAVVRGVDEDEFFDDAVEGLADTLGIDVTRIPGTRTIGGEVFHGAQAEVEILPGISMGMRMYFRLDGRNFITIGVTQIGDVVDIDDILTFFNEPGADLIYQPAPPALTHEDFVGTWVWNVDEDYTITFNADGTGSRGYFVETVEDLMGIILDELGQAFIDEVLSQMSEEEFFELMILELYEPFEWEYADGHLFLDFEHESNLKGFFHEDWAPTIEGNLLIIESLDFQEFNFVYIKQ